MTTHRESLQESKPAAGQAEAQPMRVLFCCNPGYFQHLAVALTSLLENNQRHALDVTIIASAADAGAEQRLIGGLPAHPALRVTILHCSLEHFQDLPTSFHITLDAYLRFFAIDLLPPDTDRILYLDSDLLVLGDLSALWTTDLGGHALAAVPDPFGNHRRAALGMPAAATYVNSGVQLINVRRWREERIAARLIDYASHQGERLLYHDQDAINALLHAETLTLPYRWNFQVRMFRPRPAQLRGEYDAVLDAGRDPAIIHYTSAKKPWMFTAFMPRKALYHAYLDKTPWRGTPMTSKNPASWPEAAFNASMYAMRIDYTFDEFLRKTNIGRVIARSAQGAARLVSMVRPRPPSGNAPGSMNGSATK